MRLRQNQYWICGEDRKASPKYKRLRCTAVEYVFLVDECLFERAADDSFLRIRHQKQQFASSFKRGHAV